MSGMTNKILLRHPETIMPTSVGPLLRHRWRQLSGLPGGRWLFSRLLGAIVPYSGTLRATVVALAPGRCTATLRSRRRVRNHLDSVHAMALANLAELASGLALLAGLPPNTRAILTGFEITYLKKSRGQLRAEGCCEIPPDDQEADYQAFVEIRDESGEITATATAHWRVGPEKR